MLALAPPLFTPGAAAQDTYDGIAGTEWDSHSGSFSYAGAGIAHPLDKELSLTGRVFGAHLKYKFESGGKTLTAKTPIFNPSIGLKLQKDRYVVAGSVGLDLRDTKRDLAAGGTETSSEQGLSLQAEAYLFGPEKTSLALLGSFSTVDDFIWARVRGKKGVYTLGSNTELYLGGEVVEMGNSDFSATELGAIAELYNSPSNISVRFKGGYKTSSAFSSGSYIGLEAYWGF